MLVGSVLGTVVGAGVGSIAVVPVGLLVGPVLGAVVGAGVGSITVGPIGLLLLVVDGHEVLHVHRLLPLLVRPDTHRSQAEMVPKKVNVGVTGSNPDFLLNTVQNVQQST